MSDKGWYADLLEEGRNKGRWQPVLQVEGWAPGLEVYCRTEEECVQWIRENVLGKPLLEPPACAGDSQ